MTWNVRFMRRGGGVVAVLCAVLTLTGCIYDPQPPDGATIVNESDTRLEIVVNGNTHTSTGESRRGRLVLGLGTRECRDDWRIEFVTPDGLVALVWDAEICDGQTVTITQQDVDQAA